MAPNALSLWQQRLSSDVFAYVSDIHVFHLKSTKLVYGFSVGLRRMYIAMR